MSVGERISILRKEKNITQYELAKLMGVSRQAVSKWENGQTSPDTVNLILLADILDTQVEYLAAGKTLPLSPPPEEPKIIEIEKIVEVPKVVEQVVKIEKPVYIEVEKVIEVEKPVIKKVFRIKYVRNPVEFLIFGCILFLAGLLIGIFL